jgi:tetratricopeptide (TPR) repeat protein
VISVAPARSDAYDLAVVLQLMESAFTAQELRRFCLLRPSLRPVRSHFGLNASLAEMLDTVLEYCWKRDLIPELLAEIRDYNPDQYDRYQPHLADVGVHLRIAQKLPPVYHNLPHPDYGRFVGREEELARIHQLLKPYPHSRYHIITIDGIGGIGKSALALEAAYHYLRQYDSLPPEERFGAIIWASAKQSVLTAEGIISRRQALRTLDDVYTTISRTLDREEIIHVREDQQPALANQALCHQRSLLILDNFETVDDEQVLAFVREVPDPTKVIVTTRHRIDVAYPVRLMGMPEEDGLALITQECKEKGVTLTESEAKRLYDRTGGVPLAMVWSMAQIGYGHAVETMLRRLAQPTSDIARYCFQGALKHIRGTPAYKLLMALAIFVSDASREALGYVADLPELDRDDGLVELQRLSLVNKHASRFRFLPLTKVFAADELSTHTRFRQEASRRWVDYLKELSELPDSEYYWRYRSFAFHKEGPNILEAIEWSYEYGTAEDVFHLTQAAEDYLGALGDWNTTMLLCDRALELATSLQRRIAVARFAMMEGYIFRQRGDYEEAESKFLEALSLYEQEDNWEGKSIAMDNLAAVYRKMGMFDQAQTLSDEAMKIADTLDDGDLKALINIERGRLARDTDNWELAWEYFTAVRDWFEERVEQAPRDEMLARSAWGHLAIVAYHLGRPQEAKELCLESLDFFETYGTKAYLPTLKYRLALAEQALGEYEAALQHAREAVDWFVRLGMELDHAEALALLQRLEEHQAG